VAAGRPRRVILVDGWILVEGWQQAGELVEFLDPSGER